MTTKLLFLVGIIPLLLVPLANAQTLVPSCIKRDTVNDKPTFVIGIVMPPLLPHPLTRCSMVSTPQYKTRKLYLTQSTDASTRTTQTL